MIDLGGGWQAEINGSASLFVTYVDLELRILLVEEFSNDTGVDWIGFRDELIGDADTFNEAASGGFAAAPFDMALFDPNGQEVLFSGGTLAAGDVWVAGSGQGALQIDVDLSSTSPVSFVLSQVAIPVPTPGTLALLAIGGLVLVPRRMRL
jgi:hypothetical protein